MTTDPIAIDLEEYRFRARSSLNFPRASRLEQDCFDLIAAVETLRERVTKLNGWLNEHESMLAKLRGEVNAVARNHG